MRTLKLIIEYDGTNYVGWQHQKNGTSIQERVEWALQKMTQEKTRVIASGRTDAGVHALAQVVSFQTKCQIPVDRFLSGLRSLLPHDITVRRIEEVDSTFHAQWHAKKKTYRYLILNDSAPSALFKDRAWHIPRKLNLSAMRKATRHLVGRHDFSSFKAARSNTKDNVRTISHISIVSHSVKKFDLVESRAGGRFIEITVVGDGFVRNQVRNIVGTLVEVGMGKRSPEDLYRILSRKKRTDAGRCAPARGLYLVKVIY